MAMLKHLQHVNVCNNSQCRNCSIFTNVSKYCTYTLQVLVFFAALIRQKCSSKTLYNVDFTFINPFEMNYAKKMFNVTFKFIIALRIHKIKIQILLAHF